MSSRLPLLAASLLAGCPLVQAADAWSSFAPESADLVFAAPAASGTGGMFGHVLLRLRGERGDVAVGYMADLGDDGMLALAWKGLVGGYRASYAIEPWEQERRGYQDGEGRPVWIYPLRLDPAGLDRLLATIAAAQGTSSDYHLLSANCAGGIADLLDRASPGSGVRAAAGDWASPGGVLRAAQAAGLLEAGTRLPGPGSDRHDPVDDRPIGRLGLGVGHDGEEPVTTLSLRPAWHGLDDPRDSIALGDALEVLAVEGRWLTQSQRAVLQRATLLAVQGCAPDGAMLGRGWRAALETRRELVGAAGRGDTQASLAVGLGLGCRLHEDLALWLLAIGDGRLVDDLAQPAGGAGLEAGLQTGTPQVVADARVRWLRWDGQSAQDEREARGGLTWAWGRRDALRLDGAWRAAWGWRGTGVGLQYLRHF